MARSLRQNKILEIIAKNERIAQIIFTPYLKVNFQETDELDGTTRGTGGFGSTNA